MKNSPEVFGRRLAACGFAVLGTIAIAQVDDDTIVSGMRAALRSDDREYAIDAAGLTRSGRRIVSLEPLAPFDPSRRRLVIVGGLDGQTEGAAAVLQFVRWWTADKAADGLRGAWQIAAVPCALPDACGGPTRASTLGAPAFPPDAGFFNAPEQPESRFVWRWVAMQAPDLVIEVRAGDAVRWTANTIADGLVGGSTLVADKSLAGALGIGPAQGLGPVAALGLTAPGASAARALQDLLFRVRSLAPSPLHRAISGRIARAPLDVARLMAGRYPEMPSMSYIPALSWTGAMRLSRMTGETRFRDRARGQMAPFLSGEKPAIGDRPLLTSLAGHLAFADAQTLEGDEAAGALARKAADFILPEAPEDIVRFRTKWTDDMFMAASVLARVAAKTRDVRYTNALERLLIWSGETLQRPDGLFVHAEAGPHAWGRGNGFAAFGLMEALTHVPDDWTARPRILEIYKRQMKAMVAHQAPDGMWRQVVDEPGSYREFTVTAMTVVAMARGLRLGWLDESLRPVVDRAWRGVLARVAEDGTLLDVCTGTGAGPTKAYYLDRAAIIGADDRGGAMALTAALEMAELRKEAR